MIIEIHRTPSHLLGVWKSALVPQETNHEQENQHDFRNAEDDLGRLASRDR
jgi:hypothetical protein